MDSRAQVALLLKGELATCTHCSSSACPGTGNYTVMKVNTWAACTTHPTWQIDRLREDRERREAAQTDQVAPLQLKAGITAGTKMLQVRDSWQLLH